MGGAPSVTEFFDLIARSLASTDLLRVRAALDVASNAHAGQLRQSGEPYVTHPIAVAKILIERLEPDADAVCAALLHDVVEDSNTTLASIREQFGSAVALIVDGVSKLDNVRTSSVSSAKEETLRKLVSAGGQDWRVFAVKLCDRLHNMRTLGAVGSDKRRRVAVETHAIFFPLARYVGFQSIATEMEALSLKWLHPWRWKIVDRWSRYRARFDRRRLGPFLAEMPEVMPQSQIASDAPSSDLVMVRHFRQLSEDRAGRALFSVPSIFVSCASLGIAYRHIGSLHSRFVFVPASFSCDASEGVVATKVLLGLRGPVAEFIFSYPRIARGSWVRALGDSANSDDFSAVANAADHPGDFTRVLRDMVIEKSISVFSPKGRRLSLPRHASGLDFAFAIHTELGLRATHVRVNGVLRSPSCELYSGDIVEVVAGDAVVARPDWEALLRSPRSRAKLRQWLRETARIDAASLGERLLVGALGVKADLQAALSRLESNTLADSFGVATQEELLRQIGTGELSAFAVASRLRGSGADVLLRVTSGRDERSRIVVDGRAAGGIQFCPYCQPIPGDQIVASASASGVKVHRFECPLKSEGRTSSDSFVPVWAAKIVEALPVTVTVHSEDRRGLLADCARAISDVGLNVLAVKTESTREAAGYAAELEFTVLVRSRAKYERCLVALKAIAGVLTVSRTEVRN